MKKKAAAKFIKKNKLFIVIASIGVTGVLLLAVIFAAPFVSSFEPETNTSGHSGALTVGSDPLASNGSFIKFGMTTPPQGGIWKPALNSPWMWYLGGGFNVNNASHMGTGAKNYQGNNAPDPVVYDIDGFENSASVVSELHNRGKKVICYISAGSAENWRPDYSSFTSAVKGNGLDGWAGETWLDIRRLDVLGPIMQARLDMCKQKGFDAVEFDNVDGYTNSTGFPLTAAHQITYNTSLANWAHDRGLSAALKNDVDQISQLWQVFDFAINEECNNYDECDDYTRYFIANNKAVFNAEYEGSPSSFCPAMNSGNFNSAKFPLDLDGGRNPCR